MLERSLCGVMARSASSLRVHNLQRQPRRSQKNTTYQYPTAEQPTLQKELLHG